jgi:broad specificity phosphatase PhoE
MRLLLIRHAETDWNGQKRLQGWADVPLNAQGQAQAAALGRRLEGEAPAAIYASPSERARDTALAIAGTRPILTDARLQELHMGKFEGLIHEDAQKLYPQAYEAWLADPENPPPQGEKRSELLARVLTFWEALRPQYLATRQTVLIVSHGGCLRILLCVLMGLDSREHWRFQVDTASLTELYLWEGGLTLARLNDTCHLNSSSGGKA